MTLLAATTIKNKIDEHKPAAEALFAELADGRVRGQGITRDTYGPGENHGHKVAIGYAKKLGLEIRHDAAANSYMTLPGRDRSAAKIVIGSHLDSVPNGGNFDGAAGVLAGLIAVSALKDMGIQPACDITVMGIRAEESIWFQVSYIGSRSALGLLPDGALEAPRFDTGRSLAEHLAACGGDPDAIRRKDASLDPKKIRAFLELHIEQAPTLLESGKPIGIGTHVPGNFRYPYIRIRGRHDHVGTPRRFRQDSVIAGSDLAMELDRLWAAHDAQGNPMAITLGRFHTNPAVHGLTIVPGELELSLDVRAYDPVVLAKLEDDFLRIVHEVEARRAVEIDVGNRAEAPIGVCCAEIISGFANEAARLAVPFDRIVSPASHDAAAFAQAGVPIGMIFVRNENGSHNPDEHMEIDDFLAGTSVLARWLQTNVT